MDNIKHNISAQVETEARDCDGMHSRHTEYLMEDEEKTSEYGDLDFFERVLGYTVSTGAEAGTLSVRQDENGLPVFDWSERTEEGYNSKTVRFTKE